MSEIERLLVDMKERLEREIHALSVKTEHGFEEMLARFDTQAVRLDRQTGAGAVEKCQAGLPDAPRQKLT